VRGLHHDLPGVDGQVGIVEAPVELLLGHRLVRRVVIRSKVIMRQRLGGGYPLLGVEDEHALEEIDRCNALA